jgi:hypothetical protein
LDLGRNWETIFDCATVDTALHNAYKFFLSADFPQTMYVYALNKGSMIQQQIWVTHNVLAENSKEIKWTRIPYVPLDGWIGGIEVDPSDSSRFWVLYTRRESNGKLWYFDGKKYTDCTGSWGDAQCESLILQRGSEPRLYVGSDRGVFTSKAYDSDWLRMAGIPGTFVKSLAINYANRKLIAGTFGRGIWQVDLIDP